MFRHCIVGPIVGPLPAMFVISVVFEIRLIVFFAAASSQIDHVSVTRVLRKQDRLFAQTVVIQVVVEFAI